MRKELSIGVLTVEDTSFSILKIIPKSGFINKMLRRKLYVASEFTPLGNLCPVIVDPEGFKSVSVFMLKVPCDILVYERTKADSQFYGEN